MEIMSYFILWNLDKTIRRSSSLRKPNKKRIFVYRNIVMVLILVGTQK